MKFIRLFRCSIPYVASKKVLRIMKLIIVIMTTLLMQVSASTSAQLVTLRSENISLKQAFEEIRKQTGYIVLYKSDVLKTAKPINVNFSNTPLEQAVTHILSGQNLAFSIKNKSVIIKKKEHSFFEDIITRFQEIDVRGKVFTESGQPLSDATVAIKGSGRSVKTNEKGEFYLQNVTEKDKLLISYIGYETLELGVKAEMGNLTMKIADSKLEEITVNAGYYTVKESERTGSISKITSKEIGQQPVANPLAAMQGRIAGVNITQNSGVPGGGFDIQIRGRNSLRMEGNMPLYIVDGVPYNAQPASDAYVSSLVIPLGNISPLNTLNPNDIESIEVLKDADATAIYGSRGANGVVLITTKKGNSDKTSLAIQSITSVSRVTNKMKLMNTSQYLKMREDAFANDGLTPSEYDYDANGTWGDQRDTDWQKEFLGNKAISKNKQFSLSGGSGRTNYLFSGSHRKDETVFPEDFGYKRTNFFLVVNHTSKDDRFNFQATIQNSNQKNNLMAYDFTNELYLSPNAPEIYDTSGNLNWENNTFENPMAKLNAKFKYESQNFLGNVIVKYKLSDRLQLSLSGGLTEGSVNEYRTAPSSVYNPTYGLTSEFSILTASKNNSNSWIIEPGIRWNHQAEIGKWDVFFGATLEERKQNLFRLDAFNFTSDDLIFNTANAVTQQILKDSDLAYRYMATYARINYNLQDKYIFNATGRRDGSSRFGKNNRFANFGSLGFAWLFSRESFLADLSWLNFGKFRSSYGITGSDLIGDYQYLNTYGISSYSYDGLVGLEPMRLYNPNFSWENNKKLEFALELEFFNGRIATSVAHYRNRSSNQLVGIPLPGTTGFNSVQANLNATVENTGWEFSLMPLLVRTEQFKWSLNANLTIPRNKLISFPNLPQSTYANQFVIGEPISIRKVYNYLGVNKKTGLYEVEDVNNDGVINNSDRTSVVKINPEFYGGLASSMQYKSWSVDFLIQFVKQRGYAPEYVTNYLGSMQNQPIEMIDYWSANNTTAKYQLPTTGANGAAVQATQYYKLSNGVFTNSSFMRLKNVQISYNLFLNKARNKQVKIFAQGQNLFTITPYKGLDPETNGGFLPALRTFAAGFEFLF
jgi:TonB-linked SusC/RagA family outer membrane protein